MMTETTVVPLTAVRVTDSEGHQQLRVPATFRQKLKSHLFRQSYPDIVF